MATDQSDRNERLLPLIEEMMLTWHKIVNEYQGEPRQTLAMLVRIFGFLARPMQNTSDFGGIASFEVENIVVAVASHDVGKHLAEWCIKMEEVVRTTADKAGVKGFPLQWETEEQTDGN